MIFKFGTRKAFQHHKEDMPREVFSHLQYSIDLLDENYGAGRDIDHDDGSFVLLFTHPEDFAQVRSSTSIDFTSHIPECFICRDPGTCSKDYASAVTSQIATWSFASPTASRIILIISQRNSASC